MPHRSFDNEAAVMAVFECLRAGWPSELLAVSM
jgi:hypothetical protein